MKINADKKSDSENLNLPGNQIAELIARYDELIEIQNEIAAVAVINTTFLTEAYIQDHLTEGIHLLSFDNFFPGWERAERAFVRVFKWATGWRTNVEPPEKWTSVNMGERLFRDLARIWYGAVISGSTVDPQEYLELTAIVGACLKPFLQAYAKRVILMVEQSRWRQPYCPVCGGSPDLSYLAKADGARWLLCSRCDSEWLFQRVTCPHCGTHDQTKLAYFTDDTGQYRLYVCCACRTYIKTLDMRQKQNIVNLPLERILTLDLDQQAGLNGYIPMVVANQNNVK